MLADSHGVSGSTCTKRDRICQNAETRNIRSRCKVPYGVQRSAVITVSRKKLCLGRGVTLQAFNRAFEGPLPVASPLQLLVRVRFYCKLLISRSRTARNENLQLNRKRLVPTFARALVCRPRVVYDVKKETNSLTPVSLSTRTKEANESNQT